MKPWAKFLSGAIDALVMGAICLGIAALIALVTHS
jgi:hypothetical protein